MGIVRVNKIKAYGRHGCMPQETKIGQYFYVDVEIHTDFSEAAKNDDLNETVDYVIVNKIVVEEMKIPSKLIEHAGHRIIQSLRANVPQKVEKYIVTIIKPNPPINGNVDTVEVVLEG